MEQTNSVHLSAVQGKPLGWSFPAWWQNSTNLHWYLMHMLSRWKEPNPGLRNANTIALERGVKLSNGSWGMRQGDEWASRASCLNSCQRKREIASAILFSTPATWAAVKVKPQRAVESRRSWRRCIKAGTFEVQVVRIATTASLSDRKRTCFLAC